MFGFLRWQWLWRSRQRLFVVGLGVFVLGVALLALLIALWASERPNRNIARGIPAPVILMAVGGFMMLQAAFSGGGAFGDHETTTRGITAGGRGGGSGRPPRTRSRSRSPRIRPNGRR